jgi:hypothetical protein
VSTRPSYKTFVVERPVAAPREAVWEALLDLVGAAGYLTEGDPAPHGPGATTGFRLGGTYDLVERVLSLEPPWRRCYEIVSGGPVALYQGTITIRDDGPRCLLVWSYLCDPGDDPAAEAFLAAVQDVLRGAAGRVAEAAEAAAAAGTTGSVPA